jgi:hypothetical protein
VADEAGAGPAPLHIVHPDSSNFEETLLNPPQLSSTHTHGVKHSARLATSTHTLQHSI